MAISAPTELDHKVVVASASTVVSNAVNFTAGRLYLVAVGGSGATARTCGSVTGAGGTWTEVNGGADSSWVDGVPWAVTLFTSTNANGTAVALTGNFSANWANGQFIHIFEIVTGFDTSGLVVQSVAGNQAPTATAATCNLANSGAAGNLRLGYFVHRLQEAFTAANGGTLVGHQQSAAPASVKALWYLGSSTTADPSVTWPTNTRGAGYMGIEIKAAATGTTLDAACTIAATLNETAGATNLMGAGVTIAMTLSDAPAGTNLMAGAVTSAATGTLAATGTATRATSATIAGSVGLAGAPTATLAAAATLAASAALSAAPTAILAGEVTVDAFGTLDGAGTFLAAAAVTIAGAGHLDGSPFIPPGFQVLNAACTIDAVAGCAAAPSVDLSAACVIDARSTLTAAAVVAYEVACTIAAALTATASPVAVLAGLLEIAATGHLSATATFASAETPVLPLVGNVVFYADGRTAVTSLADGRTDLTVAADGRTSTVETS